jgi:hypothetical protein
MSVKSLHRSVIQSNHSLLKERGSVRKERRYESRK